MTPSEYVFVNHSPQLEPHHGSFFGKTHHFALRVYYEDTDAAGVVYYANYLRFLERARSDMLRGLGVDQRAELENGQGAYAVTEVAIRYLAPARLDDALAVVSEVQEVRAASCVIHQKVMRNDQILADAKIKVALLSPEGRPRRQPRAWVKALERLKGG